MAGSPVFSLIEKLAASDEGRLHELRGDIGSAVAAMLSANRGTLPVKVRQAITGFTAAAPEVPVDLLAEEFCRQIGYGDSSPEFAAVSALARGVESAAERRVKSRANVALSTAMWLTKMQPEHGLHGVPLSNRDRLKLLVAAVAQGAVRPGGAPFEARGAAATAAAVAMRFAGGFSESEVADVCALVQSTEPGQRRRVGLLCQFAEARAHGAAGDLLDLPAPLARLAGDRTLAVLAGHLGDAGRWAAFPTPRECLLSAAKEGFASQAGESLIFAWREVMQAKAGQQVGLRVVSAESLAAFGASNYGATARIEGSLHPDVLRRINEAVLAMNDGPKGARVRAVTSREGGGIRVSAEDAKLEITRSGAIMHYRKAADGSFALADDGSRGIPAVAVPRHSFAKCDFQVKSVAPQQEPSPEPARLRA